MHKLLLLSRQSKQLHSCLKPRRHREGQWDWTQRGRCRDSPSHCVSLPPATQLVLPTHTHTLLSLCLLCSSRFVRAQVWILADPSPIPSDLFAAVGKHGLTDRSSWRREKKRRRPLVRILLGSTLQLPDRFLDGGSVFSNHHAKRFTLDKLKFLQRAFALLTQAGAFSKVFLCRRPIFLVRLKTLYPVLQNKRRKRSHS